MADEEAIPVTETMALRIDVASDMSHIRLVSGVVYMPINMSALQELVDALQALVDDARTKGVIPPVPGSMQPKVAKSVVVLPSLGAAGLEKFVGINFDPGLSSAAIWVLPDLNALRVADAIQTKVFNGMSVDDQQKMLTEVGKMSGAKPRLIMPGGKLRH